MIVSMTKYNFLIYYKEYDQFLHDLRELGMLHVVERQAGEVVMGSALQQQMQLATRFEDVLKAMALHLKDDFSQTAPATQNDALEQVAAYEALLDQKARAEQELQHIQKEIDLLRVWGDFSWESVASLQQAGYVMRFFSVNNRNYNADWQDTYNAITITDDGVQTYFITLTPAEMPVEMDDVERVKLPDHSLSACHARLDEMHASLAALEQERLDFTLAQYQTIEAGHRAALEAIDYSNVVLNSSEEVDQKLLHLEGWVPTAHEAEINTFLDQQGVVYTSQKATKEDAAPIKLWNNPFARLFHPITELYEMPAYAEVDLTPFFAPFFVMFFGLCLGDAGYGVILLLIGLIARMKVKPSMKPYMTLLSILGFGTMVCGFISGTFMGIPLVEVQAPWIQKFKKVMLTPDDLFSLSLMIGCVQILFGMFIKAIGQTVRYGFKNVLATWGWLVVILGCGITYGLQSTGRLSAESAQIGYYVAAGIGGLGIFILNDIKRNPLINIGAGLWDTYNMATGLLGDILSYVRLFALGISGSVLGLVFNDLAMKMSPDIPVVGFLVSALILFFGHSMNIFMSGLGAFVHPMRLTFVEFYKNAGFEGGGKAYNPFARVKKQD